MAAEAVTSPVWRVLGKLEGVRKQGTGFEARCPAHDDRHASLSVGLGLDGKVLLNCHTGCSAESVLDALHLDWSDLFEKSAAGNPIRRFKLNGNVIHVREDLPNGDKKLWWESNGKRGLNGTKTADLPLFGADRLDRADDTSPIVVVEGEKAAQALWDNDTPAVGTVTGADQTPSESSLRCLAGRECWLWPDNDDVGRGHMQRIAAVLSRLGCIVYWVDWPTDIKGGDAADYLAAGNDPMAIKFLLRPEAQPEPRTFNADALLKMQFEEKRWAIPDVLAPGLNILASRPKLGKTWLALGWAIDIATGGRALGAIKVDRGETLYMALEDGKQRLQDRLNLMLGTREPPSWLHFATEWPRLDEGGIEELEAWLTAHRRVRLVVIDTFKRIRPKEKSTARLYDLDYDAIAPLAALARAHNVAIVVVFHTRKGESSDPLEMVSGTLGLSGAADAVLVLQRERGQADASLFLTGRDIEEQDLALKFQRDSDEDFGWILLGDAEDFRKSRERQEVLDAIEACPGMRPSEIADAIGKTAGAVRYLLFKMVRESEVRVRDGKYYPTANTPNAANTPNVAYVPNANAANAVRAVRPISGVSPVSAVSGVSGQCTKCRRNLMPGEVEVCISCARDE